jgi:hypothetical protein
MTQKWLLDRYESGSEITDPKWAVLNDLGLLVEWGPFNGSSGDVAYALKPVEDMPDLTGAQVRDVTMGEEVSP